MARRVRAPRQLKRRERPWPRLVGKKKRTTKQWATFAPLSKARRKSEFLRAFEEEVVARKVVELVRRHDRPVTLRELTGANPGLFHPIYVRPIFNCLRVRSANRYPRGTE